MSSVIPKTALISLSDKSNLKKLITFMIAHNIKMISTGGTYKAIKNITDNVIEVAEFTGFKEMMDGRVKTLHPKIHAGILSRRGTDSELLDKLDFEEIDLVVVNLYPFEETIQQDCSFEEAVEQIDIGGPTMIRAAAKNFHHVTVLTDPKDYESFINEFDKNAGISLEFRKAQAAKVFATMANYNNAISKYFGGAKTLPLRYGENPHQSAELEIHPNLLKVNIANAHVIQGKALSYNNIADADAAWECLKQFSEPSCVIVKHANPCGVGQAQSVDAAYRLAYQTDPTSAFGGIIALNREANAELMQEIIDQQFVEVLIAPKFTKGALGVLQQKENIRVLQCDLEGDRNTHQVKIVSGGLLRQTEDIGMIDESDLKVVTQRAPSPSQIIDLLFAWKVAKYVKSNAIVFAKNQQTIGIGAGQMSRVISAAIANMKAQEENLIVENACMASDAFFPFRDGIDTAAASGITAIIQPGGSMRDDEVIAAADEHDIAMVFTGMRHFRH